MTGRNGTSRDKSGPDKRHTMFYMNSAKPILIKANIDGAIVTFKVIPTILEVNTQQDAQPMYPPGRDTPIYLAGRKRMTVRIEGIMLEDPNFTEKDLQDWDIPQDLKDALGYRKLNLSEET
jgi:hypothetical protein